MLPPHLSLEPDEFHPGCLVLTLDGRPQSHVNPLEPWELFDEYARRVGHVLDAWWPAGQPIRALHLGAGAMTLPRYLAATRPGSAQQVVDIEPEVFGPLLERLPLPEGARVETVVADAAAAVHELARETFDAVVVDLHTPGAPDRLSTPGFLGRAFALARPDGVLLVNCSDDDGRPLQRRLLAGLDEALGQETHLALLGPTATVRDGTAGNTVILAAREIPSGTLEAIAAKGPHPGVAVPLR